MDRKKLRLTIYILTLIRYAEETRKEESGRK